MQKYKKRTTFKLKNNLNAGWKKQENKERLFDKQHYTEMEAFPPTRRNQEDGPCSSRTQPGSSGSSLQKGLPTLSSTGGVHREP